MSEKGFSKFFHILLLSLAHKYIFLSQKQGKKTIKTLNVFKLRSLLAVHNIMSWNDRNRSTSVTFLFVVILHHISASHTMYNLYFIYIYVYMYIICTMYIFPSKEQK